MFKIFDTQQYKYGNYWLDIDLEVHYSFKSFFLIYYYHDSRCYPVLYFKYKWSILVKHSNRISDTYAAICCFQLYAFIRLKTEKERNAISSIGLETLARIC